MRRLFLFLTLILCTISPIPLINVNTKNISNICNVHYNTEYQVNPLSEKNNEKDKSLIKVTNIQNNSSHKF